MRENRATVPGNVSADVHLDITNDVCPLTFVRTRLKLEQMAPKQVLELRLAGEEPLKNLPRALADEGHEILALEETGEEAGGRPVHRLILRKKP